MAMREEHVSSADTPTRSSTRWTRS
jgi:hypothetical protein